MRWFKHLTSANRDEGLLQLRDEFGVAGYGVYWIILELIGEKISEKNEAFLKLSKKNWRNFCEFSPKKFQKFLKTCSKLELFLVKIEGDFITVECPNLLKYRDEWSKKKARKKSKNSGVTPERLQSKDTDTDIDIKEKEKEKKLYPPNFQKFWKAYPKKVGKGAAAKQYKNISSPRPSLKIIMDAITKQKQTEQWQNKKYIPNPATWLSQRRWEDEITASKSCLPRVIPLTPEELKKQAKEILS